MSTNNGKASNAYNRAVVAFNGPSAGTAASAPSSSSSASSHNEVVTNANAATRINFSNFTNQKSNYNTDNSKRQRKVPHISKSNEVYCITPYQNADTSQNQSATGAAESSSTSNVSTSTQTDKKLLSSWGFPDKIVDFYQRKGIHEFFQWQVDCLDRPGVLESGRNLVYSAPTSAGKTMVSDVLLYKTLLERKKKAIIILPFVSITVEKVQSLKQLFRRIGIRIDSFAGNTNPRGGLARVDVAVCTIEKANNMLNKMIEEGSLSEIGIIIVDELHMLGDGSRGYLLELLLSKLLYVSKRTSNAQPNNPDSTLQIVGMSATIPNLPDIAKWLDAELYVTNYRPVPLYQRVVRGDEVFEYTEEEKSDRGESEEKSLKQIAKLPLSGLSIKQEEAPLIFSAIETLIDGYSALVFCSTKALCEKLGKAIAENIFEFGAGRKLPSNDRVVHIGKKLIESIDANKIQSLLLNLRRTSSGIDKNLELTCRFGVAFHHAGLSMEERALIEKAFRDGTIRILCSTTTLSAGVNLPARRVLINTPFDYRNALLDVTTYRQMIGRAGRKGIDLLGEAMLFCKEKDFKQCVKSLVQADMSAIKSCLLKYKPITTTANQLVSQIPSEDCAKLEMSDSLKRAILEVIANGTATNCADIGRYIECTFFQASYGSWAARQVASQNGSQEVATSSPISSPNLSNAINQVFDYLTSNQLIYLSNGKGVKENSKLVISPLGKAIVASGVSPDDGQFIMKELDKARRSMSLVTDLHLIYQVTPTYVAEQLDSIDWNHYLSSIWTKLNADDKAVAQLVGIRESYLVGRVSTFQIAPRNSVQRETQLIHQRFYASMALNDLVQEMPLTQVAAKYRLSKGHIQSLQQQAATFAGMLTTFCAKLGWYSMELLIEQFQPRLSFGIQRELIDLMRIPFLTSALARQLFSKGYETLVAIIYRKAIDIEEALISTSVFEKKKPEVTSSAATTDAGEPETIDPGSTKIYIPNLDQHITLRALADLILQEARIIVEADVGQKLNFDEVDSQSLSQSQELESGATEESEQQQLLAQPLQSNAIPSTSKPGNGKDIRPPPPQGPRKSTTPAHSPSKMIKVGGASLGSHKRLNPIGDQLLLAAAASSTSSTSSVATSDPVAAAVGVGVVEDISIIIRQSLPDGCSSACASPIASGKGDLSTAIDGNYRRTSTPNEKQQQQSSSTPKNTNAKMNLSKSFVPNKPSTISTTSNRPSSSSPSSKDDGLDFLSKDDISLDLADLQMPNAPPPPQPTSNGTSSTNGPPVTVVKDHHQTDISFMSLGDSLNDISWNKIVEDKATKFTDEAKNGTRKSSSRETSRADQSTQNKPTNGNGSTDNDELISGSIPLFEGRNSDESDEAKRTTTTKPKADRLNQTRSGSPILFHSDDSMMSFDDPASPRPVDKSMSQSRRAHMKRPLSTSTAPSTPNCSSSSEDLSDFTCDEIDQLIKQNATQKGRHLAIVQEATEAENGNEIEFFQTFRQRQIQQSTLPPSFEPAATTKVSIEKFQLILVSTERKCQQLLEEIFAEHVLATDAAAVLDIVLHFHIEPIVNSFFTKIKTKAKSGGTKLPTESGSQNESEGLRIEDRSRLELTSLYVARLGHPRVFVINSRPIFKCLQARLLAWLIKLDPEFELSSSSSQMLESDSNTTHSSPDSRSKQRFRFLTYDIKKTLYILQYGFHLPVQALMHRIDWHDLSVALWLLDPEAKRFDIGKLSLQDLVQLTLRFQLPEQSYFQKAQTVVRIAQAQQSRQVATNKASGPKEDLFKTAILFHLTGQFGAKLASENLYMAYKLIELPARLCLYMLETQGIQVDYLRLSAEQGRIARYIESLESRIYQLVGSEFNLNSPEQIARVLYQQLNLLSNYYEVKKSSARLTKGGVGAGGRRLPKTLSTSKLALIKLQEVCGNTTNLPTLIMEWRRLTHAYHQSIVPIRNALHFDRKQPPPTNGNRKANNNGFGDGPGYIYCQCDEWSATGRISLFDPNLINVDKDFDVTSISLALAKQLDRLESSASEQSQDSATTLVSPTSTQATTPVSIQLRKYIRARDGYVLISADYAQLELRILAHFSKDSNLLATLNDPSNDVFKSIAAAWKCITLEEVTYDLRQQAKQICYGIIYGIGNKSLAENLAVTEEEAEEFRTSFLQRYTQIDAFVERVIEECATCGYVETISHRRRPIPNIFSEDSKAQSKAKRQAVNTMIQGSAADIIKLSMVAVDKAIQSRRTDAALVMQMHDELMYEVRDEAAAPDTFARLLKQQMENVSRHLDVILPVKVRHGHNWGQLREYEFNDF